MRQVGTESSHSCISCAYALLTNRVIHSILAFHNSNSSAFRKPDIIKEMVAEFGPEKVTVAIDVDINESLPSGYEVYIDGGRTPTGADAIE